MKQLLAKYSPYLLLTAAIMVPLLAPGYILTLDLVFTPELRMPEQVSSDYLWQALLHLLNIAIPGQIIEKALLLSIPLLAGIGMHQLLERVKTIDRKGFAWHWAIYAGGIFYAANPFTYSRFMAGQYAVLLGYALLPFFVRLLLACLANPSRLSMLKTVGIALLISVISIHTFGEVVLLGLVFLVAAIWQRRQQPGMLKTYLKTALAGIGLFVLLSSYWLVPLALGKGDTAHTIQSFDSAHTEAFATQGGTVVSQILNIFKLQGFWVDGRNLYVMPQDQLVGWGTLRLIIWILVGWGMVACWRYKRSLAAVLGAVAVLATIVALGIPGEALTALGYREPHKFVGLIAFVFAILLAFGIGRLLHKARTRSETAYTLASTGCLLVVILFTPTMYWGLAGQLSPREYPKDWHAVNDHLNTDKGSHKALFLPWHQYMSFDFSGRIIANPAQKFFDTPTIVNLDPELGNIKPEQGTTEAKITSLLKNPAHTQLGKELAKYDVKYVILAKDHDYRTFDYLNNHPDFTTVKDGTDVKLYRNTAYKGDN